MQKHARRVTAGSHLVGPVALSSWPAHRNVGDVDCTEFERHTAMAADAQARIDWKNCVVW